MQTFIWIGKDEQSLLTDKQSLHNPTETNRRIMQKQRRMLLTFKGAAQHTQHHAKVRHAEVVLVLQVHKGSLICTGNMMLMSTEIPLHLPSDIFAADSEAFHTR